MRTHKGDQSIPSFIFSKSPVLVQSICDSFILFLQRNSAAGVARAKSQSDSPV
jgi:hypothetical protein